MIDWQEISDKLRSNHFYPAILVEDGKETGLEISCPPIQKDSRLHVIKETIGEGFEINFLPNESNPHILIKRNELSRKKIPSW